MVFIRSLLLTVALLSLAVSAGAEVLRVTVFDVDNANHLLKSQEYKIEKPDHSHFFSLMRNQSRPVVKSIDGAMFCSQTQTPVGMEIYFRTKQTGDFRHDFTVSFMSAKAVNQRVEEGIEGCESLELYDVEKSSWSSHFGAIKGFPKTVLIEGRYKVIFTVHE